jgi:hypothetical protein
MTAATLSESRAQNIWRMRDSLLDPDMLFSTLAELVYPAAEGADG